MCYKVMLFCHIFILFYFFLFFFYPSVIESVVNPNHNPFTVPHDNDVFMLRDKERQRKKQVISYDSELYVRTVVIEL